MPPFQWPGYPTTEIEFEKLMAAVDKRLAAENLKPNQRPLHVGRMFWQAFAWGGRMTPPKELADLDGYEGDVLMAKALRWYAETLGDRLKSYFELGYVPAQLANTIWRVRISNWFGSVNFFAHRNLLNKGQGQKVGSTLPTLNVLTLVEQLPQGLVDRLSNEEITDHFNYHMFAVYAIQWLTNLPALKLFGVARDDYSCSTNDLIAHRYSQSRWATQQCVEKLLKGFLQMSGTKYPTGGRDGHDLIKLAKILQDTQDVVINSQLLGFAQCSTGVRYQDEKSTETQAFQANVAALSIFDALRQSSRATEILRAPIVSDAGSA